MNPDFVRVFVQLLANALLLFASSFLISTLNINPKQQNLIRKILTGLLLGGFVVVIIYNALNFGDGLIYDTRTVLISVVAFFFPVETAISSALVAGVYRYFFIGGVGRYAGVLSILTALLAGIFMRALRKRLQKISNLVYFYILGVLVSILMILSQFFLPYATWIVNVPRIILPVMLLYPILTVLLSISMNNQLSRIGADQRMKTLQSLMKASLDAPEQTSIFALNLKYEYLFFNKYHHDFMKKHDLVDVYPGMNLLDQIKDVEDYNETKSLYDRALEGEAFTIFRQFKVDGSMMYYKNNYGPVFDDQFNIIGLAVVATEITQTKVLEAMLLEKEESYRLLISRMKQSLALHELIYDDANNPISYRFLSVNEAFLETFRLKLEDVIGKTREEVFPMSDDKWKETLAVVALTGSPMEFEAYSRIARRHLHYSFYSPKPNQCAAIITDITERIESLQRLEASETRLRNAVNEAPIAIMMIQEDGEILQINNRLSQLLGYTSSDLKRIEDWWLHAFGAIPDDFQEQLATSFKQEHRRYAGEFTIQKKNKDTLICDVYSAVIGKTETNKRILMNVVIDITDRKKKDEEILFLSYHDPLTGLYNRRFYDQSIWNLRQTKNMPLSIIMADINGLKFTNDAFGHGAGDQLLLRVRDLFNKCQRKHDIVARIGGDEFILILPKTTKEEAVQLVDGMNLELEKMVLNGITISVSFGVSTCFDTKDIEDTIKNAEIDMYHKKLYELSSKRSETVKAIISTLYLKSPREEIHSKQVATHAVGLGQLLGMRKDELNLLRLIGNLHDIGKIAIDEQILNKPDPLTDLEWQEIKKHPETGYRILAATVEYIEIAEDILAHHERIDGSGYPKGLKGNKIPLRARIIAIADAYEAMTSERPYAKQMTTTEAAKELKRCTGTQFDQKLVQKFIEGYLKLHYESL